MKMWVKTVGVLNLERGYITPHQDKLCPNSIINFLINQDDNMWHWYCYIQFSLPQQHALFGRGYRKERRTTSVEVLYCHLCARTTCIQVQKDDVVT
jgi:hypothetical protein